jgi:hypothetical protein
MPSTQQNAEAWQGEDRTLTITLTASGTDLSTATAMVYRVGDGSGVFSKTLGSGVTATSSTIATVAIASTDLDDLEGTYAHELRVTDASGNESVTLTGYLTVHNSTT